MDIDEKKLKREILKERIRILWNNLLIFLEYMIREPYYEFKELFKIISNNEVSLMYSAFALFIYFYYSGIRGIILYIFAFIIFTTWIYGIYKSGEWKKYYRDKYFKDDKN